MKYNLKNRPHSRIRHVYLLEFEEWFEGFQKELRQILEECKTTDKYDYDNETYESCVREILGENDQT